MRRLILLAAKLSISAALFFIALRGIDLTTVLSRIHQISLGWILFTLAVTVLQLAVSALRWREIAKHCGAELSPARAFRYTMIGAFFSLTLPSTIGGDAVRLWLINRNGTDWRTATYSVLVDRAIGFIGLALVALVSLPWSYAIINDSDGRVALLLIVLAASSVGLGFLVFGRLRWRWLTTWWATRHLHACAVIANQVIFDGRSGPRIVALSFINPLLAVLIAWGAAQSIAVPVGIMTLFQLIPPVTLITMMPISIAGWGVREAAMTVAFSYAGLPQADGLITSLLYGACAFVVGTCGGLIWISSPEKGSKSVILPTADK